MVPDPGTREFDELLVWLSALASLVTIAAK